MQKCKNALTRAEDHIHNLNVLVKQQGAYIEDLEVEGDNLQRALNDEIEDNNKWYKKPEVVGPIGIVIGILVAGLVSN